MNQSESSMMKFRNDNSGECGVRRTTNSSRKIDFTIDRAQRRCSRSSMPEGYWQAPLEANAEMNAEYIIFSRFMGLGRPRARGEPEEASARIAER